ncbi:MAG: hypothetical protein OXC62_01620 [Aestuariivita sp.]|nr:hypothetical protein [Aestuariivita sp.]
MDGQIFDKNSITQTTYKALGIHHLSHIAEIGHLSKEQIHNIRIVGQVFPFRTNRYVLTELINWNKIPNDPIYRLVFPQRAMLEDTEFTRMADLIKLDAPRSEIDDLCREIQCKLNPHPAGQRELNIPTEESGSIDGLQHKYRETALFFPSRGQTCHAYCTFCFRWAQFTGNTDLKISSKDSNAMQTYLAKNKQLTDLLITGGDPMVMKTRVLERYLTPMLHNASLEHIVNIRIGTKALSFWPHRFTDDTDADDLMRLFEKVVQTGRHLAIMAHFNHPRELETDSVRHAIQRIRNTGAVIRTQSPLLNHINNNENIWADLWKQQVKLGLIPYYMFVERDTGARHYFEVPLAKCLEIYQKAIRQVSGLARTVRGPSMSATPGKVEISGIETIGNERVFVLRFLQGRDPSWVGRPFFAKYNPQATWLDHLEPAFKQSSFFFEER